jgi:hypothetical protein
MTRPRRFAHLLMSSVAERVMRVRKPISAGAHPEREFLWPDALVAVARA